MEEGTQTLKNLFRRLLIRSFKNLTQDILPQAALDLGTAGSVCTYIATLAGMQPLRFGSCHEIMRWYHHDIVKEIGLDCHGE